MTVLGCPARSGQARVAAALEAMQRVAQDRVVIVDHRLSVGRLIACQTQRVQRKWVVIGRGALLLKQTTEHADLSGGQVHRLPSYEPQTPDATSKWRLSALESGP